MPSRIWLVFGNRSRGVLGGSQGEPPPERVQGSPCQEGKGSRLEARNSLIRLDFAILQRSTDELYPARLLWQARFFTGWEGTAGGNPCQGKYSSVLASRRELVRKGSKLRCRRVWGGGVVLRYSWALKIALRASEWVLRSYSAQVWKSSATAGSFRGWFLGFCVGCPCFFLATGRSAPSLGDRLWVFVWSATIVSRGGGMEYPPSVFICCKKTTTLFPRACAPAPACCCFFKDNRFKTFSLRIFL